MNTYLGFSKFLFKTVHDVFNIPELEYFRYGTRNLGLMQGHREVDRHSDKKKLQVGILFSQKTILNLAVLFPGF